MISLDPYNDLEISTKRIFIHVHFEREEVALPVHTGGAGLLCSVAQSCLVYLWPRWLQHARLPCPSLSWSLLRLTCIGSAMSSNHIILCHPLFLLLSIFPSICVFPNELALGIRWPKYWSLCFSTSPSNEYSGLISFTIDWFDLLAVQGTLKSLLQHHS